MFGHVVPRLANGGRLVTGLKPRLPPRKIRADIFWELAGLLARRTFQSCSTI